MALSDREIERYARQLVLPDWSVAAQERLRDARAIVVGAGALGCPAAAYLVAAGVGRVGIVDDDVVELSNLHRQTLHSTDALGRGKAEAAAEQLGRLNEEVVVEPYPVRVEADNAAAIVAGCDVVLDCSDSFASRYLVNDACCAAGVSLVEAGVAGFEGLVMTIEPGQTACYRCAFPTEPARSPSCAETGILGPVAGIIGSLQALEALKLLAGVGRPLRNSILHFDASDMTQTVIATARRRSCLGCGGGAASAQLP
jgi:molybdopterin/thiamine biosynthesis adenylyltransferase